MSSWFSYYQRWCSIVLLVYQMGHDIQYMFIHWETNPLRLDDKHGLSFRLWVFVILFQMLGTQLDWCWERERAQVLFSIYLLKYIHIQKNMGLLWSYYIIISICFYLHEWHQFLCFLSYAPWQYKMAPKMAHVPTTSSMVRIYGTD